jgi:hypothetical protein
MPIGHVLMNTVIAKMISRSLNQSATIFVITTFSTMTPVALRKRPTMVTANVSVSPIVKLPSAMDASPATTIRRSPILAPSSPPGNASTTPGNENSPMSTPSSALPM